MSKKNKLAEILTSGQPVGSGSVFPNLAPKVVDAEFDAKKYNRHQRRHGAFVVRNNVNGQYLHRTVHGSKITFKDVDLDAASLFRFEYIGEVMNQALVGMPNLDLTYEMCYTVKGERRTI